MKFGLIGMQQQNIDDCFRVKKATYRFRAFGDRVFEFYSFVTKEELHLPYEMSIADITAINGRMYHGYLTSDMSTDIVPNFYKPISANIANSNDFTARIDNIDETFLLRERLNRLVAETLGLNKVPNLLLTSQYTLILEQLLTYSQEHTLNLKDEPDNARLALQGGVFVSNDEMLKEIMKVSVVNETVLSSSLFSVLETISIKY